VPGVAVGGAEAAGAEVVGVGEGVAERVFRAGAGEDLDGAGAGGTDDGRAAGAGLVLVAGACARAGSGVGRSTR